MSGTAALALVELALVFGGVLAFAWWQLRALKRDRAITEARLRGERERTGASEAGPR